MTKEEVFEHYGIPISILEEYHDMGLCNAVRMAMDDWRYNDEDLKRLGLIMALYDMGFQKEEVESYIKLLLKGDSTQQARMKMLNEHRRKALDEIHLKERQLKRMDYLRHEIRKNQKNKQ